MAFVRGPTFGLSQPVLLEADHMAGAYIRAKRRGCTIIVDNATTNMTLGPGVSFFKPGAFGSFGTPCAGAFLRAVEPGRAQAWASHACDGVSGTVGFIKYPIQGGDGQLAGRSLFIFWNVPGPEGHSKFALAVSAMFQGSSEPAWCAALLPTGTPDAEALDILWHLKLAGRVIIRRADEAKNLVTLKKFNGVQLSGTMVCASGEDHKDYRIYIKFGCPDATTNAQPSSSSASSPINVPHIREHIDVDGLGRFGVCVEKTVYALHVPKGGAPTFDMVLIHGLQGGAAADAWVKTWSCKVARQHVCWPVHFLINSTAPDRFEHLRILSVTYNADAVNGDHGIDTTCRILADSLRTAGVGDRPVVFVAHSLGGLVMKHLISVVDGDTRSKDDKKSKEFTSFFTNMRAMVFYGTPHGGAPLANSIITRFGGAMLPFLKPFNARTHNINNSFENLRQLNPQWQLRAFAEGRETRLFLWVHKMVVPEASAHPAGWPHNQTVQGADHFEVCRATNAASLVLQNLVQLLQDLGAT